MVPVILAGGLGTRLRPLSSEHCPKQFLSLISEYSMLQETLLRLDGVKELQNPVVVCNNRHQFLAEEQLRDIQRLPFSIILEPVGRNTAPAVAVAALAAIEQDDDAVLLVLPADHVIEDIAKFHRALNMGNKVAQQGKLVTFGVFPKNPETGYGYIKTNKGCDASRDACVLFVERFVEKPDLVTAKSYLESGDYFWNSGMFMFNASCYLDELQQHEPEILNLCTQAYLSAKSDMDFVYLNKEFFKEIKSCSIDYAVMEKTDKAVMIPLDAGWQDIGSWDVLLEVSKAGNHAL